MVLVVGALALVGLSKPLRGRLREHGAAIAPAAVLAPLGVLWVAGGIVDSLTGAIGWATGGIWDAVRRLVAGTVSWITDWVDHVIDWASAAINAVSNFAHSAYDWATTISEWALHQFGQIWDQTIHWVGDRVSEAVGLARGLVDQLRRWAADAINAVASWADGTFTWLRDNVWGPLWDKVTGLAGWITGTVLPWVTGLVDTLRGWVEEAFRWTWDHALDAIRPFVDWATTLLRLVEGAAGWLEWLAAHSFDWFTSAWHSVADANPEMVSAMVARAFTDDLPTIEEAIAGWLD